MASIYKQKNSPFFWIRYYDILEPDPKKKRKSINTKIRATRVNQKNANDFKRKFETGLNERNIYAKSGIQIKQKLLLTEGLAKFISEKSVPGANSLKPKTLLNYRLAANHLIKATEDKEIIYYSKNDDYYDLLRYFENINLSNTSRSIYSRALKTLWNYFVQENIANENIIVPIREEERDPDPIPLKDMKTILNHLKGNSLSQYQFIYFCLLCGCRPSTAMVQRKEWIDLTNLEISMLNVKARKKKRMYKFPIYSDFYELLKTMDTDDKGRLFEQYHIGKDNYTESLKFWKRQISKLYEEKQIGAKYMLKQIRPTFASYVINELGLDVYSVKNLLDHSDIRTTDKHYINLDIARKRKLLDEAKFGFNE